MKRERDYRWYVEPLDSETNKVIAEGKWDDSILEGVTCADGSRRNLWLCDREFIAKLKRSKKALNLKFTIYVQEGRNGSIRHSHIN
jgi:hypothetical protein